MNSFNLRSERRKRRLDIAKGAATLPGLGGSRWSLLRRRPVNGADARASKRNYLASSGEQRRASARIIVGRRPPRRGRVIPPPRVGGLPPCPLAAGQRGRCPGRRPGGVDAFERRRSFQGKSSFKTWLLQVVGRAALTVLRRQSPRRKAEVIYVKCRVTVEDRTPDDVLEAKEVAKKLRECIDCILRRHATPRERLVYYLCIEQDLPYPEVAKAIKGRKRKGKKTKPVNAEDVRNIMRKVKAILAKQSAQLASSVL